LFFATFALWRATQRLVGGTEQTARRQLRAYVAVERISFVIRRMHIGSHVIGMVDPNQITGNLALHPKNYGETPAFDVSIHCLVSLAGVSQISPDESLVGRQMLHPGMTYEQPIEHGIAGNAYEFSFGVFGHIVYRDIFRRWYRTNFCYNHIPTNVFTPEDGRNQEKGPYDCEADALKDVNEAPHPRVAALRRVLRRIRRAR